MKQNLVLVGCCGSGKDFMAEVLVGAYPKTEMISMSSLLSGGNSDGTMVNDSVVSERLFGHLESIGFHRRNRNIDNYILQGVGRTKDQMNALIQCLKGNDHAERTIFCKFNISVSVAMKRMWSRYQGNLITGKLRKEESQDVDNTRKNFLRRLRDWQNTREGIFRVMDQSGMKVLNINAQNEPSVVAFDLLSLLGWDTRPAMEKILGHSINENSSEDEEAEARVFDAKRDWSGVITATA